MGDQGAPLVSIIVERVANIASAFFSPYLDSLDVCASLLDLSLWTGTPKSSSHDVPPLSSVPASQVHCGVSSVSELCICWVRHSRRRRISGDGLVWARDRKKSSSPGNCSWLIRESLELNSLSLSSVSGVVAEYCRSMIFSKPEESFRCNSLPVPIVWLRSRHLLQSLGRSLTCIYLLLFSL